MIRLAVDFQLRTCSFNFAQKIDREVDQIISYLTEHQNDHNFASLVVPHVPLIRVNININCKLR